ncbi:unnamed protein product [Caenorhabditis angaria]|uniref:Uncharacterized protein n=1 Tax=Caenorhabditis angaria TaxID=860376 RepID=A0A9P1NAW2_9PELO|nr:unnamed protein product [Caenorhabditis angaria]
MKPRAMNPGLCVEPMIAPSQWVFSLFEIILSSGGLILNIVITVVSHKAIPMAFSQRRILASISINFALLSGFQLARHFFLFLIIKNPCLNQVTTISCKLQEFPLLFCYIHCAVAFLLLGLQANCLKIKDKDKRPITWFLSCSVWQSTVAAICVAITMLFTAFDQDPGNISMAKCSILLAVTQSYLTFGLLTLLITCHFLGFLFITIAARRQEDKKSWITFTVISLKEIIQFETIAWQFGLFISGCVVIYKHVLRDTCEECAIVVLEISFVLIPLIISFVHPLYLIWYVLPIRDAATRTFPCILTVLPEYSLVPPTLPSASTSATFPLQSPRTETTVSSDFEMRTNQKPLEKPRVVVDDIEWSNE